MCLYKVLMAILLGFLQTILAAATEVCIIFYLASLSNLLDIIMKFVSMAAISKFDTIYASALAEEKMMEIKGKVLPIEYKRYMGVLYSEKSPNTAADSISYNNSHI